MNLNLLNLFKLGAAFSDSELAKTILVSPFLQKGQEKILNDNLTSIHTKLNNKTIDIYITNYFTETIGSDITKGVSLVRASNSSADIISNSTGRISNIKQLPKKEIRPCFSENNYYNTIYNYYFLNIYNYYYEESITSTTDSIIISNTDSITVSNTDSITISNTEQFSLSTSTTFTSNPSTISIPEISTSSSIVEVTSTFSPTSTTNSQNPNTIYNTLTINGNSLYYTSTIISYATITSFSYFPDVQFPKGSTNLPTSTEKIIQSSIIDGKYYKIQKRNNNSRN